MPSFDDRTQHRPQIAERCACGMSTVIKGNPEGMKRKHREWLETHAGCKGDKVCIECLEFPDRANCKNLNCPHVVK